MIALDLIKCLIQLKCARMLVTCAHISELPSNISIDLGLREPPEYFITRISLCIHPFLKKLPWFLYKTVPHHALRACKVKQVMSGGKGNQDDTSEDLKEANHQFYFTGRIFLLFNHLFHKPQEKGNYLTRKMFRLKTVLCRWNGLNFCMKRKI